MTILAEIRLCEQFKSSGTTTSFLLNWRTLDRAIGAEYAAIALQGLQQRMAVFAFVKPLTGICRHGLGFFMATLRTGDG